MKKHGFLARFFGLNGFSDNSCTRKGPKKTSLVMEPLEERQLLSATTLENLICVDPSYEPALNSLADIMMDRSTLQKQLTASGLTLTEKDILNLNSVPGAKATIYLDFDGHTTSGTYWNTKSTNGDDFVTPRFNLDGDATKTAFSSEELWAIYEIWLRVSEDYAPFEVNVTTKDPGADALAYNGSGDNAWGKRVCIGGTCDDWLKESAGGIAWLNSFYSDSIYFRGIDTPCYVFSDVMWTAENTAEAASHEAGHTLCLNHDGSTLISGQEEYYQGANGWCPIMGVSYYEPLTQWSKGEYTGATNKEDDLYMITTQNGFTYKADDYGNNIESAYNLSLHEGIIAEGLIETNTDYDFFKVNLTGETMQLRISGLPGITNLDVGVSLYDTNGNLLKTYAPTDTLYVTMDLVGYVGTHYISVTGTGNGSYYSDYASLGAYTLYLVPYSDSDGDFEPNDSFSDASYLGTFQTKTIMIQRKMSIFRPLLSTIWIIRHSRFFSTKLKTLRISVSTMVLSFTSVVLKPVPILIPSP